MYKISIEEDILYLKEFRLLKTFVYISVCTFQSTCKCLYGICVSFQVEQMLTMQSAESDQESVYGTEQQRLREESRAYRLKLQAYQDSQQKQAQLVHKLQAKVNQAKQIFIFTKHIHTASEVV